MVRTAEVNSLKPDIKTLQADVVECLTRIGLLMGKARTIHGSHESAEKYAEYQREIAEACQNVRQLELRMAVVAPMKAGKSTIVNAIVGQDLLPSRNAAMTTLPTEIVFKNNIPEPVMILSKEIQQVFQTALASLTESIDRYGDEGIKERTSHYPHLSDLLQRIKERRIFIDTERTVGREQIAKKLSALNDIVRLCSAINPEKDPLAMLTEVIRIETPFLNLQGSEQAEQVGNLVIIDTPGPNEAGENLRLTEVVKEQLRRSSIVLIVLDFTQLNNEAAEKVKKQVQPIIDLIGKDNLYVLVNKIDERRESENSMSTEEVLEFVRADLELAKSNMTNNVFEISAREAFVSTTFTWKCQQTINLDTQKKIIELEASEALVKASEALAKKIAGRKWEKYFREVTIKELLEDAKELFDDSGFNSFLTQAVNALMESAAPRCMRSALNLSHSRLVNVKDDLRLRSSAIAENAEKLKTQVDALDADLEQLELCRKQLSKINKVQEEVKSEIDNSFNHLKKEAKIDIQDYFKEENFQRKNRYERLGIQFVEFVSSTPISPPAHILEKFNSTFFGYKPDKPIEFKTLMEAEKFRSDAILWAKDRAIYLLETTRQDTAKKIDKARKKYIEDIDAKTKPIIEKAWQRLNQEFDIELSLPELPSWQDSRLEESSISIDSLNRAKQVQRSDKKRRWYVLWLFKIEHQWEATVNEQYYLVSLESLVKAFNDWITNAVDNINSQIDQYINNEFKEEFDKFFNCLDNYLCNYRDSLKQAQEDKQLNLEYQKKLTDDMSSLTLEAERFIQSVDRYLTRTKNFLD